MRSRVFWAMVTALAALGMSGKGHANDTSAVLGAGGLTFTRTDQISMVEEDLYISPSKVEVNYLFRNMSNANVATIVAFPMPRIGGSADFMASVPELEKDNFMEFTVEQDGHGITPQLQQRAFVRGLDFTEELKRNGIPLMPLSEATRKAVAALPAEVLKDWMVKGLVVDINDAEETGGAPDYIPTWELDSVYWWETVFPADRDVRVRHTYKPSVGGTTAMVFVQSGEPTDMFPEYQARYCIDDAFMRLATRLERNQAAGTGPYYFEQWLSYILTTGSNWFGAIEKFRLTVDKGSEKNYVSFCGEDLKKVDATRFVMEARDFYPEKDLDILLLVPANP